MPVKHLLPFILISFLLPLYVNGQRGSIYTKEGRPILNKMDLVNNCLRAMRKDRSNSTALSICECQISKMDRQFSVNTYRKFTRAGVVDISGMIKSDSIIQKQIDECYSGSGMTMLLQAEGFEVEFLESCKENIQKSTERQLDAASVNKFCNCQLGLIKTKKITDAQMETLSDPNSLLFFEMMHTCGDPFATDKSEDRGWTQGSAEDIQGPLGDTIKVLTLNGMTYVKMKTGSLVRVWLFDTGAADLLINKEMEAALKQEGVFNSSNYLGTAEYEMANGNVDTCRKYMMNNVQIGKFSLNNIVVAVTDKGKRIIVGKGLLNKFSNWILDNKENTLILSR